MPEILKMPENFLHFENAGKFPTHENAGKFPTLENAGKFPTLEKCRKISYTLKMPENFLHLVSAGNCPTHLESAGNCPTLGIFLHVQYVLGKCRKMWKISYTLKMPKYNTLTECMPFLHFENAGKLPTLNPEAAKKINLNTTVSPSLSWNPFGTPTRFKI